MTAIYRNSNAGEQQRTAATNTLAEYFSDDADRLFDLAADADQQQFALLRITQHSNSNEDLSPVEEASQQHDKQ